MSYVQSSTSVKEDCGKDVRAPRASARSNRVRWLRNLFLVLGGVVAAGLVAPFIRSAIAQTSSESWQTDGAPVRHVVVTLNKSRTFRLVRAFKTAVVAAPDIADAQPMSDHVVYIQGKKIGTTNLVAFDTNEKVIAVMDIEVAPDIGALQTKIRASGSRGIQVSSSNGEVVLTGEAANAVDADRAVSLAKSLVPKGSGVVNAITVAPSQQVMLKVRFLEVTRQAGRDLGVNWFVSNGSGTRGVTTGSYPIAGTSPIAAGTSSGIPIFQAAGTLLSGGQPFGVALASLVNGGTNIDVLLSALEQKGIVRRLAEPNLVALSGDTAAFIAGGEFPVPVVQPGSGNVSTVTIQFKPFGVQLTFMPTVLANGIINLRLTPSVSELDYTNAISIGGTQVPSLIKREARTTIELRDGQSFAIAGLLQSHNRQNISQVPWVGSVPVLGALFRSDSYQKDETDLVVIVTPHIAAPATPGQHLATPLDGTIPSNDVDFFVNGQMETSKKYSEYVTSGGGIQGPYGYILRVDDPAASRANPPPVNK